jgi:hypothetical protein
MSRTKLRIDIELLQRHTSNLEAGGWFSSKRALSAANACAKVLSFGAKEWLKALEARLAMDAQKASDPQQFKREWDGARTARRERRPGKPCDFTL